MKRLILYLTVILITSTISFSQELVVGGDMESADNWTIVDIAAGDGHTETFGYTDDFPTDGVGGCLSLAGNGNWSNVAVCQELTISRGSFYQISMQIKTSMDFIVESHWVEIVVIPTMPVEDADITSYPNSLALNSWDCPDVLYVDGNFADYNCDAKSDLMDVFTVEGEGDTTVVLVLKAGGGTAYNVLLDEVSVVEVEGTSVPITVNTSLHVFPNPVNDYLDVRIDNTIQDIKVVNSLGQVIASTGNIRVDHTSIDFSDFPSGIYYVVVTDINGISSQVKALKK